MNLNGTLQVIPKYISKNVANILIVNYLSTNSLKVSHDAKYEWQAVVYLLGFFFLFSPIVLWNLKNRLFFVWNTYFLGVFYEFPIIFRSFVIPGWIDSLLKEFS